MTSLGFLPCESLCRAGHNIAGSFIKVSKQEGKRELNARGREKEIRQSVFCKIVLKVICHHSCHVLLLRNEFTVKGRGLHKGMRARNRSPF